ncbi:MAG: ABC transporter substrate-binding protein [Alphaproteobacteria bacterium]|nr:ABC transporter substrate-binding protein [Alphaproteobacteria bacterium]
MAALAAASVRAEVKISMAAATFAEAWGNPFASTSVTRLPLQSAVFDPLTLVTADGNLLPWLAIGWGQTAPNQWRIELRPGVVFSNGELLNATAVASALAYLASPEGRREAVSRELADIAALRPLDAMTLEIETAKPDPLLPYLLSLLAVPAPAAWAKLGRDAFARQPVGTGPLKLAELSPSRARLVKSGSSWRKIGFDAMDYLVLPDPAARRAALASGQADIAPTTVTPEYFSDIAALGGRVVADRLPAVVGVVFNTEIESPVRDPKVRRALTHAVNRQGLVDGLFAGETTVANQPAPHGSFGFNAALTSLPFDPDLARRLLAEAGYPNGFALTLEVPMGAAMFPEVFQQVASDLARVGVKMEVRGIPQQILFQQIQSTGFKVEAAAIPIFSPVNNALHPMRQHSCLWHKPWFCDRAAQAQIDAAFAEPDLERRRTLTENIMARAHDSAQAIYLYDTVSFVALGPRIARFRVDFSFIRYEDIRVRE